MEIEAEEQYLKAQRICEDNGDDYFLAKVKNQIGWLYRKQEDYKTAVYYYEQALEFFEKNGYVEDEANTCSNMAYAGYRLDWDGDRVISLSIDACQAIEKVSPETIPSKKSKKNYKHNLKMYYQGWSNDTSEEGYERWYQEVVLNGKYWKEVNVETKAN